MTTPTHGRIEISEPARFHVDGSSIDIHQLESIYNHPLRVTLDDHVLQRIRASRDQIQKIVAGNAAVYGVNTGFGHLCQKRIDVADVDTLQENLIRSHAVGVGPPAPHAVTRWIMLFKILALARGYSGVRIETVRLLADMLNHDILPVIPNQGSLGASGDLAPLAHMVLPMIGAGTVRFGGRRVSAERAFATHGLESVRLGAKEGLALINGTQFMSAYAAAICVRARRAVKHADIIATMSLESLRGSAKPFEERLHDLRPHPGAVETAANVRILLRDSEILPSHADCTKVQDPYSLRCVPQVHGASRDAIRHAVNVVQTEINSVTDNPIIFEDGSTVSGGNFHGQPLALALDYLAIALSELASISERRTYLLLSGHDGLPSLLMQDTGLNSGFMLAQYTSAALVSENKILATPASIDSIPTSMGQEDHVSMGATSATKCWRIMNSLETVLGIELMCAAQALDYRAPLKPGIGLRAAHEQVRTVIPHTEEDRLFGEDIQASRALVRSRRMLVAVENETGPLS